MFLAAFLDSGAIERGQLEEKLSLLGLGRVRAATRRVKRGGLMATHLSFRASPKQRSPPHHKFRDIRRLIEESDLMEGEKRRAIAIFQGLAEVEAKIHDISIGEVQFHELGTLDSILDIVGAAIVLEAIKIEKAWASKINLGSGLVETSHGRLPVPAPATLELLKGFPTYSSGIEVELTTPTGAAILRHLSPEFGLPPARWQMIGYGAGTLDLEHPNVLRVLIGESLSGQLREEAVVIETDIDDMNPQLLPHVQELLFKQGAQDVSWHALHMKKGRLGFRIFVLSPPERADELCETIFRETTTLGVRVHVVDKRRLERRVIEVETPHGRVRVKLGLWQDRVVNVSPEYDDCVRLAQQKGVPLKELMRLAVESVPHQILER